MATHRIKLKAGECELEVEGTSPDEVFNKFDEIRETVGMLKKKEINEQKTSMVMEESNMVEDCNQCKRPILESKYGAKVYDSKTKREVKIHIGHLTEKSKKQQQKRELNKG